MRSLRSRAGRNSPNRIGKTFKLWKLVRQHMNTTDRYLPPQPKHVI